MNFWFPVNPVMQCQINIEVMHGFYALTFAGSRGKKAVRPSVQISARLSLAVRLWPDHFFLPEMVLAEPHFPPNMFFAGLFSHVSSRPSLMIYFSMIKD